MKSSRRSWGAKNVIIGHASQKVRQFFFLWFDLCLMCNFHSTAIEVLLTVSLFVVHSLILLLKWLKIDFREVVIIDPI